MMEGNFREKAPQICGPVVPELKAVGKKSVDWDLNDWKWDSDLFTAAQLNSAPSGCMGKQLMPMGSKIPVCTGMSNSSSSCSEEINFNLGSGRGKMELEKRRRVVEENEGELNGEDRPLDLKLGGQGEVENWVEKVGKKIKLAGGASNRAVCQVDDCQADLSNAKDYHRRHKVCDLHSKATTALVGNVMQRFCQQCSRFHYLQEFDEGKRSCRRRLAGHNRRRRKTHPENVPNAVSLNDERSSSYLLRSLLRILSNMQSNSSNQARDQDLLSHFLGNLADLCGTNNESNLSGLLNGSQDLLTRVQHSSRPAGQCDGAHGGIPRTPPAQQSNSISPTNSIPAKTNDLDTTVGRGKLSNIDLNNTYNDSEDSIEILESSGAPVSAATGSPGCPVWIKQDSQKSSPPPTSGNSGSTSTRSPSSSSGEAQSRTDRIIFKLFGKDPSDLPHVLRSQILDWLANSPTDMESYIRPGCIILTVYLRMEKSMWEEFCRDLGFRLRRLLDSSSDSFWKTGWIYARVRHNVAFVYDGQVVLNTPLPLKNDKNYTIMSIKPIAVSVSEKAQFFVKGFNISRSTTRLLCALEGEYLVQQSCSVLMDGAVSLTDHEEVQSISFSCSIPDVIGRGFIEIEDQSLSSCFFPFIVAEPDVCSEIRTLESAIEGAQYAGRLKSEMGNVEASNQALDFVHELGWLLHRSHLKFRLGHMDPNRDNFPFKRFRSIMEFSLDRDWCSVVKKLLDILFSGTVDVGDHRLVEHALSEIGLLHKAVRRNCRPMVEALLSYYPGNVVDRDGQKQTFEGHYIFRPDTVGPGGLTPLHIAASRDGSDSVLDALTDDPQLVGIEAWISARDCTGLTPHDYACQRGHISYMHMIQTKSKRTLENGHVEVDIPGLLDSNTKHSDGPMPTKISSFQTEKTTKLVHRHCNLCEQKLSYGNITTSLVFYRPAMLSMVAIAAVCVCVALLFKSSPEVVFVFEPFRWERLKYGSS